ncbi:thiamine pyrophosphate-dependent dehydrogenase E1 component subunit alpha [Rhodovulum sp. 12E13]|uniref:thiamine pyrophosphate-dependent dehydrogenase E1 component subunit alpha n=1 Tax=Rhodovulum sp. 12E13 TaxID=2203891 RepID=UPI000E16BEA4|nr:thiamine pyrophosphate-dependent dehydrogenase E1 component subunit alpha [Rhodovulum sp. 12E13]RDC73673.1 thiamine pyrophosphate-dependent dehydrogenase E1 component subunit alpha [Rhodovulum sp. 12E13]
MTANTPSDHDLLEMHRRMVLTRHLEEKLGEMHKAGRTRGPIHRCDGQEAVGVGATAAMAADDYVTTTHRGHAVYLGRGLDPRRVVAEIFGRETGYCGGRGGHMLVGDVETGMMGGNAIVGASIPAATGMALSMQLRGEARAALAVFGDGAAQTGICHESMNIAALWRLPVVFLLEHNAYGLTVHHSAQSSVPDLAVRAAGYGMPGETIDGNDVLAVYGAVEAALQRARRGEGPSLIEARTYRVEGFSTSDMGGYQPDAEIAEWRARDPILLARAALVDRLGAGRVEQCETEARAEMEAAFEAALADPMPAFAPHVASAPYAARPEGGR